MFLKKSVNLHIKLDLIPDFVCVSLILVYDNYNMALLWELLHSALTVTRGQCRYKLQGEMPCYIKHSVIRAVLRLSQLTGKGKKAHRV